MILQIRRNESENAKGKMLLFYVRAEGLMTHQLTDFMKETLFLAMGEEQALNHASALTAAAKIQPIEFQNQ